ncbi:MAG: tetratricopeptide (TPR) repeat protein [Saprospiraceae bacterium]
MEKRRTIREYLDNPRLLSEISIEQLEFWAEEVPYAAIIHQLLAMKVVQEERTPESREILQKATLYSPNPDRLSRTLHKLGADASKSDVSHTYSVETAKISTSEFEGNDSIEASNLNEEATSFLDSSSDIIEEKIAPQEDIMEVEETKIAGEDENELSDFSQWLLGLRKVARADSDDEIGGSILDGHQDITSETLAELLAQQGHSSRAIAMYEQLSLKYPKKSGFFAAQIQKIQGL